MHRRSTRATTAAVPTGDFDPVAYAATIAIAAAEKRLRASHARGASVSTARPSSTERPAMDTSTTTATTGSRSRRVIAEGSRELDPAAAVTQHPPSSSIAAAPPRTLLEELASASDSASSSATSSPPLAPAVTPLGPTAATRSPSPPPPPPRLAVSPPTVDGLCDVLARSPSTHPSDAEENAAVTLRDASPLRERSVAGTAGVRYHTCTVEAVHVVVRQLNFALYQ